MKKGFTLIELLIVFAIIGTLSALILPNFMGARERARDSQRKSDLRQIQKALELYKQDKTPPVYPTAGGSGTFPGTANCWSSGAGCTGNIYLRKVPGDPKTLTPTPYYYAPNNTNLTFSLCACLENIADTDSVTCTSPCPASCTNKCYIIIEQ